MNNPDTIVASFFFFLAIVFAINALIIFKLKNAFYLLLSALCIVIVFFPILFLESQKAITLIQFIGFHVYLVLFPLYLIKNFNSYLLNYYKFFLIIPLFSLTITIFISSNLIISFISLLMVYTGLLALITLMKSSELKKILQGILISSVIILAISIILNFNRIILYLPSATFILCFFVDFLNYRKKVKVYISQLNKSYELNMKTIHQITRLQQSNDQFRRIIEEKDQELLQISRHVSLAEVTTGIGHEIAQPLTGIKGIAQNMIDDINYEEFDKLQAIAELTKISVLVDKTSSIIDHIRNFSKKSGFNKKEININNAIYNAIDLIKLQIDKKNIDISLSLNDNLHTIYGDVLSIEQVVVNMILNARDSLLEKKAFDKEYQPQISISTYEEDINVVLEIEDNGTGIPKEIISKIWSPFFTSKKRKSGTGMGLSISYKIIKEHDGTAFLDTGADFTRFTFRFPFHEKG